LLNQCCASAPDLESILRARMSKIVLQHNRGQSGKHLLGLSISGFDPLRSCAAKFAVMQTTSPHWNNYVVGFRFPLEGSP
jgi:hypothetical protein